MEARQNDSCWHPSSCWVITERRDGDFAGRDGREIHGDAISRALGVMPVFKRVRATTGIFLPWSKPPPDASIVPPWPELIIAIGRQGLRYARWIRAQSRGKSFLAVLQKPALPFHNADFIWVPSHDRLHGRNVISTLFSPHPFTAQRLQEAARQFASSFAVLPRPRVGVLIGGSNSAYRFDLPDLERLCEILEQLCRHESAGLIVSTSQRTEAAHCLFLKERLAELPALLWDRKDREFYPALLGSADVFVSTPDSVNMIGEAASTGKPILVFQMHGRSPRFRRFHEELAKCGITRPLGDSLEFWSYPPVNATKEIAQALRSVMLAACARRDRAGL